MTLSDVRIYFKQTIIKRSLQIPLPKTFPKNKNQRILAISCYLADKPNLIEDLLDSVKESRLTQIDFVVSNNSSAPSSAIIQPYVKYTMPQTSKYVAVSRIMKEQFKSYHDYVIIIDDDVKLPVGFFDKYFQVVRGLGLALSQPALTYDSHGTWLCSYQINDAIAHLVSFIETGPVTCFDGRIVPILPFTSDSSMGWGLDFVWARIGRERRWPMGVVDLVPVQHTIRGVAKYYDGKKEYLLMAKYLSRTSHMPRWMTNVVGQIVLRKDYPELL